MARIDYEVGDKVVCVRGSERMRLIQGHVYTVRVIGKHPHCPPDLWPSVGVEEVPGCTCPICYTHGGLTGTRFKKVQPKKSPGMEVLRGLLNKKPEGVREREVV